MKKSTIPTEEAKGVALFDGKREEKRKWRWKILREREKGWNYCWWCSVKGI